jgi:hypothetical protein
LAQEQKSHPEALVTTDHAEAFGGPVIDETDLTLPPEERAPP